MKLPPTPPGSSRLCGAHGLCANFGSFGACTDRGDMTAEIRAKLLESGRAVELLLYVVEAIADLEDEA